MKFLLTILASLIFTFPVYAVDVVMGAGANLVFDPAEITINAGDTVRFVNEALPPHNVIVKGNCDQGRIGVLGTGHVGHDNVGSQEGHRSRCQGREHSRGGAWMGEGKHGVKSFSTLHMVGRLPNVACVRVVIADL